MCLGWLLLSVTKMSVHDSTDCTVQLSTVVAVDIMVYVRWRSGFSPYYIKQVHVAAVLSFNIDWFNQQLQDKYQDTVFDTHHSSVQLISYL